MRKIILYSLSLENTLPCSDVQSWWCCTWKHSLLRSLKYQRTRRWYMASKPPLSLNNIQSSKKFKKIFVVFHKKMLVKLLVILFANKKIQFPFSIWGLFVPPNPTTNIFVRIQKYWTKKSFFSASKAISRIIFLSHLVWFYCFHEYIDIGWIIFFLVGYIARPIFSRCIVTIGVFVL